MSTEEISIHALREEGDLAEYPNGGKDVQFLSTPSARRATHSGTMTGPITLDFYPRPPRGGRPFWAQNSALAIGISIHALREEGDEGAHKMTYTANKFLSTPSARRATRTARLRWTAGSYFYPRPPRGGRLLTAIFFSLLQVISIHALREEGAVFSVLFRLRRRDFYPRPPRGGRRTRSPSLMVVSSISIHALREEGAQQKSTKKTKSNYFYPRPPRGGRPILAGFSSSYGLFLSTPSARRATSWCGSKRPRPSYFYPRPPRGGRPAGAVGWRTSCQISIHALREEGDSKNREKIL